MKVLMVVGALVAFYLAAKTDQGLAQAGLASLGSGLGAWALGQRPGDISQGKVFLTKAQAGIPASLEKEDVDQVAHAITQAVPAEVRRVSARPPGLKPVPLKEGEEVQIITKKDPPDPGSKVQG
jgi:hypothetical protein